MKDTIDLGKFILGKNNIAPDTNLPEGSLSEAVNVDITKEGEILSCGGYLKSYSGTNIHSIFERYFIEGSDLKILNSDNTATIIKSGLSLSKFLTYCKIHGDIYYSNGEITGIIGKNEIGVPTPPNNPTIKSTTGMLYKGVYQIAICYKNDITGEISGANLASKIELNDNSGILLSSIPIHPDGYKVVIYCSTQNGTELYKNAELESGITDFSIINTNANTKILNTQFLKPLPAGHIIRHFKSRVYVCRDNILWYSDAFRYGLHLPSKNFFQFPSKITVLQMVTDGIYVVADKTYFLSGTEPKNMRLSVVSDDYGLEGTGITIGGGAFNRTDNIEVAYWFSNKGAILGLPGGIIEILTENRLAIDDEILSGATLFKESNGIRQLITSFSNSGQGSNFSFGAQATSQIIRNGVIIP